ncbi:MAG: hypothetical protein ABH882_02520 [Candidatus Omnitrophota bacterium]|nr:hypothetical protein [Candidatus Omnitrophota bacterium]MBU1928927.1 hypothetical protein [Candidatus Omnitrophota bacterium]MBU2035348.1 hypothetical protein [Candidatus Omnitrophota bacterium]MBU2221346.1 hypothetical protein [Candidatus Omnitrophota bacterium]MBU2258746.1 hypothetical protein [Candidatus Omnitrophota bacterium]
MEDKVNKQEGKKKGFFGKLFEKLDKKIQEKANSSSGCCRPKDKDNNSCCS